MPNSKKQFFLLCFFLLCAVTLLCSQFINSHDDFFVPDTGLSFSGSVQYSLTMGNGRFIGNILGNFLPTRFVPNLILRSLTLYGIILLFAAVFTGFDTRGLLLSAALFVFPGVDVFAQAYQWSHGFWNYVPPVLIMLAALAVMKYRKDGGCTALVLCGIAQCLFAENITVVCVFVAVCIFAFGRNNPSPRIAYLIGTLVGGAVMLLMPKLLHAEALNWYRGVSYGHGLERIKEVFSDNLLLIIRTVCQWVLLWTLLFVCFLLRAWRQKKRAAVILLPVFAVSLGYSFYGTRHFLTEHYFSPLNLPTVLAFLLAFACFVALTLLLCDRALLLRLLFPFLVTGLSVCELLFVAPIGSRCLFVSYAAISVFAVMLVLDTVKDRKHLSPALLLCVMAAFVLLLLPLRENKAAYELRLAYIERQLNVGATVIEVIDLPHPALVYASGASELFRFTYHQDDPDAMRFVSVTMEDYLQRVTHLTP